MMKYLLLFICLITLQSCIYWGSDDEIVVGSGYTPITVSREIFESTIELQQNRPVSNAGKIYVKDQFLFINEKEEGFHIYNNQDPENPEAVSFLKVPGATDLAIRGNTIFVHHYVDLLSIELNLITNEILTMTRTPDVFPQLNSPDGFEAAYFDVSADKIIVGYEPKN
ncbi:hypothetical protein [Zunongwangia sp.]|uniref:hypothetical protein n=1 Tax=Zunongwangia sp. TaxID=1965325 RepID=UPI003AA98A55